MEDVEMNGIEIPLAYTTNNKFKFLDRSSKYRKFKLDLFYENLKRNTITDKLKPIDEFCNELNFSENPSDVFHALLSHIIAAAKQYQASRKSSIRDEIKGLYNQVKKLQIKQMNNPDINRKNKIETTLAKISLLEATQYKVRSKNAKIESSAFNEKSNSRFLKQANVNRSSSAIHKIVISEDGNVQTFEGPDATEHMQEKLKKLFSSPSLIDEQCSIEDFLGDEIRFLKTLPPHIVELLKAPLRIEELTAQVFKKHEGSAPGYSGISYPLIAHIWPIIKNLFFSFANSIITNGRLPTWEQFRKMIIIPKPGKDRTCSDSYRPIALLEISYKIISGCFAERLKIAMPYVIGPTQKGFMSGRSAQDAVRAILDARDIAVEQGRPALLVGLDLSKAFDTVSHKFLFEVLNKMGFPTEFIHIIKTLISNPKVAFYINGKLSEFFDQMDGTGQGDPISSFLFNLAIEILLIKLCHSPLIDRFTLEVDTSLEMLPEAFADDVNILLNATPDTLQNLMSITTEFGSLSGLKLSKSKTEVMHIGPNTACDLFTNCRGLKVVRQIKFVGAWIFPNPGAEENNFNFNGVMDKMRLAYRSWAWRKISPLGAALVCKAIVVSVAIHILQNFVPSSEWIADANRLFRKIIWSDGRAHIRLSRLPSPIELGGLDMVNLKTMETALKIFWFRKITILPPEDSLFFNWIKILNLHLKKLDLNIRCVSALGYNDLKWISTKFYEMRLWFWSDTFRHFSISAQLLEEDATDWQSLPVFGGVFQANLLKNKKGGGTWLSIRNDIPLSKDTNIIREYVKHGVTTLAHFHEKLEDDNEFVIRINRFKPTHKFMTEFNFDPERVEEIRSINKTVQRGVECHSIEFLLFPSMHVGKYCKDTPIQAKCIQFQKGCSFITKPLKQDFILKKKWTHALAWKTWKEDHGVHISVKNWGKAFTLIHDTKLSTDIKWFCYTILYRTAWTNVKQSHGSENQEDRWCTICGSCVDQTILHKYCECPIVKQLMLDLQNFLAINFGLKFNAVRDTILFHQIDAKSYIDKLRMVAMIAAAKFSIWRLALSDSDENLHKNIIWIKACVYFELIADTYIKLQNDIDFWYKVKHLIKDWVPSWHPNICNRQRPTHQTLAGTLTGNLDMGYVQTRDGLQDQTHSL